MKIPQELNRVCSGQKMESTSRPAASFQTYHQDYIPAQYVIAAKGMLQSFGD